MKTKIGKLIQRINDTQASEINCSECLDQIAKFVDLEILKQDAGNLMPPVKQHLNQCTVCHEEYVVLHELAVMEAEDQLPDDDGLIQRLK